MTAYIPLNHPRFIKVQRDIFVKSVVADCMNHRCTMVESGTRKLDACCQYGVDVDIAERDAILARKDEIRALLRREAKDAPWFEDHESTDPDFPSGRFVRTKTHEGGCIFLAHDRRGCAVHRASIQGGWSFHGVKPHVCRLFPLSYESDAIVLSDDYADYSCTLSPNAPSVYQVSRATVAEVFGHDLVAALDQAEAEVLGMGSQLRVIAG